MRNFTLSSFGILFWYITYRTGSIFTAFLFGICYGLIFRKMFSDWLQNRPNKDQKDHR